MSAHFLDSAVGVCPGCKSTVVGHVRGDTAAGVYGWTCPACDRTHDPTEVGFLTRLKPNELIETDRRSQ